MTARPETYYQATVLVDEHPSTTILADKPAGNLDTKTSSEILELFQRLNRKQGTIIVFVTHEPEIATYCQSH